MLVDNALADVRWPYVDPSGIQHGSVIESHWTDEALNEVGLWRLQYDAKPDGLVTVSAGPREWRGGQPWQTWTAEPVPASNEAVNDYRDQIFAQGTSVALTGGPTVPVDTRTQNDLTNIQGLVTFAQIKVADGNSDPFPFRGADNLTYDLTPAQLIELGLSVMGFRTGIYQAAWAVKADIAAGTLTDAAAIPAAFDTILGAAP
ncbi:MAG: DUF4376 domain-containing protein [Pseudomonadota bacterium]